MDFDPSQTEYKFQGENLQVDISTPKSTSVHGHKILQTYLRPESTDFHLFMHWWGGGFWVGWVEPGHSGTLPWERSGGFCPKNPTGSEDPKAGLAGREEDRVRAGPAVILC